jgi:hypothetical protein
MDVLGKKIGGQCDHYKDGIIIDYKITSAWGIIHDTKNEEWEKQLNIYARLFRENGYPVTGIRIVCILRDWDKNRALRERDYPQTPILVIPLNVWTSQEQDAFLESRVRTLVACESMSDDELPVCSEKDRWCRPATYACGKYGSKRATKVCATLEEANQYCQEHLNKFKEVDLFVAERPGVSVRCEGYCLVKDHCSFYKELHSEDIDG